MPLCDPLLRAAEAEFYRPYFSQEILDEVTRNLVKQEKMTEAKAARYQSHIKSAFPEVSWYICRGGFYYYRFFA